MELYRDRQAVVEEMRKEAEKDPTRFTADDYAVMNFDFPEPELNYDLPQMSFQKTAEERLKESGIDVDKMLNLYGSDSTDFVPQILRLSKSSPSLLYYGRHNKVANSSEGKSRSFEDDEQGKVVSLKDSKEASNDEHLLNSPDKIELSSSAPSVMYYGEHNRVFQVSYDLPIELRRTTGEMTIEEMIEEYEKTERFRVINELAPTRRGNHKILDAGFDDLASSRQREHRILNAGFDDLSPSRHRKHRILDAGELSDESGNDLDAFGNEILLDEKYIEIDADAEFGPAETPGLMNYLPEGAITNRNLIRYNTLYDGTNVNYRPEFVYAEPAGFESELPIGVVSLAHYEVFLYAEELYLNFRDGGLPPIANSQLHWDGYFDSFYYSKPYSYLLIYLQNGVYVDHARVLFVHQLLHDYCADGFVDFYGINRSEEHVTFERFLSGSASRFEDYLIEGEVLHYQSFRAEHGKWSPSFQYYKDRVEAYLNGASQEVEFLEEETEPDPDGSKIFTEATFTPPIDITDQMPMDAEGALISQSHRHFMVIKKAEQYQKFFKFDRPEGMKMSSSQLTWDEEFEKVTSVTKTAEEILIYLQNGYFPYEDRAEFAHRVLLDYCSSNIVLERHEYDIDYSV